MTVDDLFKHADLALYNAKAVGRNAVRFFDPIMQEKLDRYVALEADLRLAIERDELILFFQPQISHTGALVGAEALLRWDCPGRGLVSPADFIPLAEECGLILSIGAWVMTSACTQLQAWSKVPHASQLRLAVNVSLLQFRQEGYVEQIRQTLQLTGANQTLLKIEMTESLMAEDVQSTVSKLLELKGLGISISMDDFGTGFSSLSSLTRFPLDQLKIDKSFVNNLPEMPAIQSWRKPSSIWDAA